MTSQNAISSYQCRVEEANQAHEAATAALADLRAARESDEVVVASQKRELLDKEHLLAQAMADLQKTSQIEANLRAREAEMREVKSGYERDLAALRENADGEWSSKNAEHNAELRVSCVELFLTNGS